jgi:hypothetical protein
VRDILGYFQPNNYDHLPSAGIFIYILRFGEDECFVFEEYS